MLKNIKAVLFDMDGLMFDTENLWIDITLLLAKKRGYDKITREFLISNLGRVQRDIDKNFEDLNIENLIVDEFRDSFINDMFVYIKKNGVPIKPGLIELLKFLRKNKIKTALASSSGRGLIMQYVKPTALEKYFDLIISGDDVVNGKPDPEIFIKASSILGEQTKNVIVLEDSYNGIRAASRAGCLPVMIPDILQPSPEIESLLFKKFDSLKDFLKFLKSEK